MTLSAEERRYAEEKLGRRLRLGEAALLEATWSEHCSYKSTRRLLALLPREAPWVILGPGRDAGVVELFPDVALAARIESHNHPSAVDPYNGAATGVGGIVRDVLSVGATPVMLIDSLFLGPPADGLSRWQARLIVRGIGDYGNRIGVPTAGGSTWFSEAYRGQPLVNVAALGLVAPGDVLPGRVEPGDVMVLAGNTTGRDGLLGSSFASKPLGEDDSGAAIQVGNPFLEKLLIDALREAYERKLLRHVKDLGGGGLAVAVSETAAASGVGAIVHLDRIHLREPDMSPVEILVSESQERMLLVPRRGRLGELLELLDSHGVEASVIGYFVEEPRLRFLYRGEAVAELPVDLVVSPPEPRRDWVPPPEAPPLPPLDYPDPVRFLSTLLGSPRVASKEAVYEAYDWGVGGRAVAAPGYMDAAVQWLRDSTRRGYAAAVAGNPRYTRLDPWRGAALALEEAYRRVLAVGAEPLAFLDNINSGNPEKPEQHGYTVRMLEGLAWAARELDIPVIGGNVSLYNEDTDGHMVDPVATVLVVGRVRDVTRALPAAYRGRGPLLLVGAETQEELGGSEAASLLMGDVAAGAPPQPRPWAEKRLRRLMERVVSEGLAFSAKSVGLGGVLAAVAKMALRGGHGIHVLLDRVCRCGAFAAAYSETPGRLLLEVREDAVDYVAGLAEELGLSAAVIATPASKDTLSVKYGDTLSRVSLEVLSESYTRALDWLREP